MAENELRNVRTAFLSIKDKLNALFPQPFDLRKAVQALIILLGQSCS
jgi:hypothetical protein